MVKHIFVCIFPPILAKFLKKTAFWMEIAILDINALQNLLDTHSQQTTLFEDGF
jgi:ABC-type antimicrobial peptide transport system permease subunit